jgi:Kef-type K+ transport system membrane component KefB/mannitol/fructose-specific phosphotransferase system IIA component (Ntr-type)
MEFLNGGEVLPLLFLLLLAALVAALLAGRPRLPGAASLLAIGLVAGLFGLHDLELQPLASIGLVYAFFLAGSAIDTTRLKGLEPEAAVFAGVGFATALLLGWLLGTRILGLSAIDALLLGAVFSTAGPFSKQFIARLDLMGLRDSASIQAANHLGEILRVSAFLVLLPLRGRGSGASEAFFSVILGPATGDGAALLTLAIVIGSALASFALLGFLASLWLGNTEASANLGFLVITATGFALATAATRLGLAPALGGFVAGLAVGRSAPAGSLLEERLQFAGKSLFLPLAMVPAGLAFSAGSTADWSLLGGALLTALPLVLLLGLLPRLFAALALLPFASLRRLGLLLVAAAAPGRESPLLLYFLLVAGLGIPRTRGIALPLALLALVWLEEAIGRMDARKLAGGVPALVAGRNLGSRRARSGALDRGDILVGLANPGTAPGLLSLAFLLRPRAATSSVRPLVVCESQGDEREMERAEHLLASAMVAARDAKVPLVPAMVNAATVAQGIADAGSSTNTNLTILGWNRAPQPSADSAGIAERVLATSDNLVIVARPGRGFELVEHFTLVIPHGAEKQREAGKALAVLGPLIAGTGAGLAVLVQRPGGAAVRALLAGVKPRGGIEIEELDSWKHSTKAAKARLRDAAGRRSGYAILSGRPGTGSWHPSFESLPRDFAAVFSESPLLVLYPQASDEGEAGQKTPRGLLDLALERGRVLVALDEAAITDAIRSLLATEYGKDRKALGRLGALFTGIAQKEAIELEAGVILLHAHVPDLEEPLVFFGARPEGWRLLALDQPVRVLVILCAPEGQRPERHLATLGELAHLFKDKSLGARLLAAKEAGDLASLKGTADEEPPVPPNSDQTP